MRFALILWLCASCGQVQGADAGVRGSRGSARVGGEVVATVDGVPITLAEVEAAARAARVPPEVALRRLEDELLLARHAEAAGIDADPRAVRRAAVQELLRREVEEVVADVDPAELAAAYAEDPDRYARPERRRSLHVMAPLAGGESARAWIEELHARAAAAADPVPVLLALRHQTDTPFDAIVEEVEPMAAGDPADPAYLRALFEPAEVGLLPAVVRSELGWHVVHLSEIEPAEAPTPEETIERLRQERLARARAARLSALLGEIHERTPVATDAEGVARALDPELFGESP